jgi:Glycosyl hydrolase family 9
MKIAAATVTFIIASLFFNSCYPAVNAKLALPQTGWACQAQKVFALATDNYIITPDYKIYSAGKLVESGKMVYMGKYWNLFQYTADISTLTKEGIYHLIVTNYAEDSFIISNFIFKRMKNLSGYATIPDMVNTLWHFQRCSPEKCNTTEWNFTGYYKHVNDSGLPLYEVTGNTKNLVPGYSKELYGGWHDAVSTDKECPNIAISVINMCHALEKLTDTSDRKALLDEMVWGLAYLLKIQSDDGSFPADIWPYFNWESPALPRHVEINKATGIVARCTAAFAVASIVLRDVDTDLSNKSLEAARKAWGWIEQNPDHFEFENLPSWRTGSAGTVLGAAVELARATGEQKYFNFADSTIAVGTFYYQGYWAKDTSLPGPKTFNGQLTNPWTAHSDEVSYGQAPIALARYYNTTRDASIKSRIKALCQKYVNIVKSNSNNPYSICESHFVSWWGFLNTLSDLSECLLQIGIELNDNVAISLALKHYEWITGFNPLGESFIIGFGKPGFPVQICERTPENTVGGLMPGMILLNGELSTYYGPYNQWSICEVGESSAVIFDLLAGFNKIYNPKDSIGELPSDSVYSKPNSIHSTAKQASDYLLISPNPANLRINFTYKTVFGSQVEIVIHSLCSEGKTILSSNEKEGTFVLDISRYAPGFYLVTMRVDGNILDHKSIIITR